jgi:DNA repair protein RecO (recombination protein O)
LFAFDIGADSLEQLSAITEAYLTTQLERGFSTLDFYTSLLI